RNVLRLEGSRGHIQEDCELHSGLSTSGFAFQYQNTRVLYPRTLQPKIQHCKIIKVEASGQKRTFHHLLPTTAPLAPEKPYLRVGGTHRRCLTDFGQFTPSHKLPHTTTHRVQDGPLILRISFLTAQGFQMGGKNEHIPCILGNCGIWYDYFPLQSDTFCLYGRKYNV
ncbi:Hypothetical predicted protein, partial [Podarcis lilfordi]